MVTNQNEELATKADVAVLKGEIDVVNGKINAINGKITFMTAMIGISIAGMIAILVILAGK